MAAKHFSATLGGNATYSGTATASGNRVTFFGQMSSPDDFGRLRVLLLAADPDGRDDRSSDVVRRAVDYAIPATGMSASLPYRLSHPIDGVCGTVTLVAPERHRAHWLGVAAALHGKRVRVEAIVRSYVFPGKKCGVSLDISMIE